MAHSKFSIVVGIVRDQVLFQGDVIQSALIYLNFYIHFNDTFRLSI